MIILNKEVAYVTVGDFFQNTNEKLEQNKISVDDLDISDVLDENLRVDENIIVIAEFGINQKLLKSSIQFLGNIY